MRIIVFSRDFNPSTISFTSLYLLIFLPLYKYPSTVTKIFGSICLNLSKTPEIPKSVEQDEKTAPNDDVASIVIIVSGQFGI